MAKHVNDEDQLVYQAQKMENDSVYEARINDFLSTIESHHIKSVVVNENFAVVEYVC